MEKMDDELRTYGSHGRGGYGGVLWCLFGCHGYRMRQIFGRENIGKRIRQNFPCCYFALYRNV